MKRLLRIAALTLLVALLFGPAQAQTIPAIVQQYLQTLVKDCDGKIEVARKALQSADLNDDGIPDWILDTGELGCDMATFYCGTAGCTLMMFVSTPNGHEVAWEGNVHAWKQIKVRGKPGIHFDLHGSACGRVGADACSHRYVFQGPRLVRAK